MTQTLSKKDRPSVLLKVTLVYYPHSHLQDITFWLILFRNNQGVAGSKHLEPDNKNKVFLTTPRGYIRGEDRPSVLLKVILVYYPHSHLQDITFWLIMLRNNQGVAGSKHLEPDNKNKVFLTTPRGYIRGEDRPSVLPKVILVYYSHSNLQDITFWLILLRNNQGVAGSKHLEPDNKDKVFLTTPWGHIRWVEVSLHSLLVPGDWLGSRSSRFNPRNRTSVPIE